jgi:hypothetical protein
MVSASSSSTHKRLASRHLLRERERPLARRAPARLLLEGRLLRDERPLAEDWLLRDDRVLREDCLAAEDRGRPTDRLEPEEPAARRGVAFALPRADVFRPRALVCARRLDAVPEDRRDVPLMLSRLTSLLKRLSRPEPVSS